MYAGRRRSKHNQTYRNTHTCMHAQVHTQACTKNRLVCRLFPEQQPREGRTQVSRLEIQQSLNYALHRNRHPFIYPVKASPGHVITAADIVALLPPNLNHHVFLPTFPPLVVSSTLPTSTQPFLHFATLRGTPTFLSPLPFLFASVSSFMTTAFKSVFCFSSNHSKK